MNKNLKPAYLDELSKKELDDLKEGQRKMTCLLREFNRICRKYNIEYWCVGGTLIGAIRHEGWIPFDADVDVAMLVDDYNKLKTVIQNELPDNMWFQDSSTDKYYQSDIGKVRDLYLNYIDYEDEAWHNGLQLDIFVFERRNDLLTISLQDADIRDIKSDTIFPLNELLFENVMVYAPHNYEQYCRDLWGGFPPPMIPENEQYPHEGRVDPKSPAPFMVKKYPYLYASENMKIVYIDMVADLFHFGHVNALRQSREMGDYLLVGIHSDETVENYKRKPVLSMENRIKVVSACRYVDQVIPNAPFSTTEDFIKKYNISIVATPDNRTEEEYHLIYKTPIKLGILKKFSYTHEISSSAIIKKVISDMVSSSEQ